jgi:mannose-6-phosphate isomerase-like protein (cupin superfamily)
LNRRVAVGVAAIVATACGAGPSIRTASSVGATVVHLAAGQIAEPPSGQLFARVQSFTQAPGTSFSSRSHQPGFSYMVEGSQRYIPASGPAVDVAMGTAVFQRTEAHVHLNDGSIPNRWLFIAVWPSAARGLPLVVPTSRVLFASTDFTAEALLPGPDTETLDLLTLAPSAGTGMRRHGGVEVLSVLSGRLEVDAGGSRAALLSEGESVFVPAGSAVAEMDAGSGPVSYLAFTVTAAGRPFETDLTG